MRAYAAYDAAALAAAAPEKPFDLIGQGVLAILIDQGPGSAPYQGVTPIAGNPSRTARRPTSPSPSRSRPASPSRWARRSSPAASHWRGGGVLLQHMPKASPDAKQAASGFDGLLAAEDMLDGVDADNWRRAVMLLETVEATELVGPHVGAEELLMRLFSEEDPRVYPAQPVRFGCTCAPEKVVRTLALYGPEDIAAMTTNDGKVTADCQFCGAHYEFDPSELGTGAIPGAVAAGPRSTRAAASGCSVCRRHSPKLVDHPRPLSGLVFQRDLVKGTGRGTRARWYQFRDLSTILPGRDPGIMPRSFSPTCSIWWASLRGGSP